MASPLQHEEMRTLLKQLSDQMTNLQESQKSVKDQMTDLQESQKSVKDQMTDLQESQKSVKDQMTDLQKSLTDLHAELHHEISMLVSPLYSIQPVPESQATASSHADDQWHSRVRSHYGRDAEAETVGCAVLSQVCSSNRPGYADVWYPAVAEHIVPKRQAEVATRMGFNYADPRNGILLLKDLELKHQAGHVSLIPTEEQDVEGLKLQILVSQATMDAPIRYTGTGQWNSGNTVRGVMRHAATTKRKKLKFGDLHQCTFVINPAPFMRALFLKAKMAHKVHNELPDPQTFIARYARGCDAMKGELFRRLFASCPDASLPAVNQAG